MAPRGDEGRGKTAISDGEPLTGVDPSISESGNRHRVMSVWLSAEYIGLGWQTRGTETSQYPQEKKSNETPLVVASESGPGQTISFLRWGCRASDMDLQR